ncbi:MAG: PrsW family intramembrane metalloprotease [Anaerolineae bacterium]|nr:PrsW family intramembrane metalloprotease [Anaerolineae bacterium]
MNINALIAALIAFGIPLIFLVVIYTMDLYASRSFRLVVLCFFWGALGAYLIAEFLNFRIATPLAGIIGGSTMLIATVWVAPIVEEIGKSLWVFYISRRPEFTYFVDGMIYGFASGIGFSIHENFLYMQMDPTQGIGTALTRSFSTCLMHGTASALVGGAVGWFRFQKRSGRILAMIGGWAMAFGLHTLFNRVAWAWMDAGIWGTIGGMAIGLAGVGAIAVFITLGIREQRKWLKETLDRRVGVTSAESRIIQEYEDLEDIIEPITKQFPRDADNIRAFLHRQVQIGLKTKVRQKINDPKMEAKLDEEIAQLRQEMEQIRRETGVYVMGFVRTIFPNEALPIWRRLEEVAAQGGPTDLTRWAEMLSDKDKEEQDQDDSKPEVNIFARIQKG